MTEIYVMLLFLLLVAGMSTGHHIAFVIGGVSIIVGLLGFGPTAMKIVALSLYSAGDDFTVAAIPMFILMANVLSRSMIADGLFESIRYLFGSFKGGLGVTAILLALLFSTTGFFAAARTSEICALVGFCPAFIVSLTIVNPPLIFIRYSGRYNPGSFSLFGIYNKKNFINYPNCLPSIFIFTVGIIISFPPLKIIEDKLCY